jgi:hypothetical protein
MLATTATFSSDLSPFTKVPVTFRKPDGSVGFSSTALTGQLSWSAMTGDAAAAGVPAAFKSFCIEGLQRVAPGQVSFPTLAPTLDATPLGSGSPIGGERAALLTTFWRQYGPATPAGFPDNTDAAAFQLAVWEITNDARSDGSRIVSDLTAGQFSVNTAGRSLPAVLRAQQWLAAFDATAPARNSVVLYALQSPTAQDQVTCVPGPVDLDVDSNNDAHIDPDNRPTGTDDPIEADANRPGVIVPVGGSRARMIVDVPQGRTATLAFDAGAARKVRVYAPSGALALEQGRLSTPITAGSPQSFWIEAFAPSASLADIAFTLTATGGGPASSDMILATAVAVDLVAHRTGGRLGEVVSEDLESASDPNTYMILTNRDFEQGLPLAGRDFDDAIALLPPFIGPAGQTDDDLAKITLKRLPSGLNTGSVRLSVSHPDAVRLFKADAATGLGIPLLTDEWSAALSGSGYLADLKSRDVDIWLEGLKKVEDFKFTMEYVAPSGLKTSDDVRMLIADWTFRGSDGCEVPFVSPVWLDALLAATDSPKKPLADPTGAFYKIHIDGLAPWLVAQLIVASDSTPDFYTESYAGGDFDTVYSTATVSRRFGVLHSAAHVLYAPEDPVVTPAQRALIRETLELNVVHNDGLEAKVQTAFDRHVAKLRAAPPFSIAVDKDVVPVGERIRGTVTWNTHSPNDRPLFIYTSDGQEDGPFYLDTVPTKTNFEFAATNPDSVAIGVGWKGQFAPSGFARFHEMQLVRVTTDGTMPNWENQAWNALKVNGFVPGDAINRNRQITSQYANMFNSGNKQNQLNPFEWFGIAAFASRLAGDGMATAMQDDFAPDWMARVDSRQVFQGLADGNLAIFIDMYKAGLAYSDNKFETINNSAEFSNEQKDAWEVIERGQTAGKIEVIWEGIDGLVDVEQRVALQRVLDKDPDLWRRATNNPGARMPWLLRYKMASPFPADTSTFQDYRVNPDGNNPRIPADATFDQVEHRLTWIRSRIPKYRAGWRATHDSIDIPKLLNGDYNR